MTCRTVEEYETWARRDDQSFLGRYFHALLTGSTRRPTASEFDQNPFLQRREIAKSVLSDVAKKAVSASYQGATQGFVSALVDHSSATDSRLDLTSLSLCAIKDLLDAQKQQQLRTEWESGQRWIFDEGGLFWTGRDNIGFRKAAGYQQWHIGVIFNTPRAELRRMTCKNDLSLLHPSNHVHRVPPADVNPLLPNSLDADHLRRCSILAYIFNIYVFQPTILHKNIYISP